jgi:hypothetical protein
MQTAISAGLVRREQEKGGLQKTYYMVNTECWVH